MSEPAGPEYHEPTAAERAAGQVVELTNPSGNENSGGQLHRRRFRRGKRALTAGVAVLALGGAFGLGRASAGGPDTPHQAAAHSQTYEPGPSASPSETKRAEASPAPSEETDTDRALKTLGVNSPDRLVVDQEEALNLARNAIGEVKRTFFSNIQGGEVGKRLEALLKEDPRTLLTKHVYSYANNVDNVLTTVINMGDGNVFDPNQPVLSVGTTFGQEGVDIFGYLDKDGHLVSPNKYYDTSHIFPDFHAELGNKNPLDNIEWTLADLLGENTDLVSSGVDRSPDNYGNVIPTVSFENTDATQVAQLGTDGSLFYNNNTETGELPSYKKVINISNGTQQAAAVAFALLSANINPSNDAITSLPGMNADEQNIITFALRQADSEDPANLPGPAMADVVGKLYDGVSTFPQTSAQELVSSGS